MSKLQKEATRLHTHTVVFDAGDDVECAVRALLGQTTRAIVAATGLSESQVQYRVSKAGINRWDFRNGKTALAKKVVEMGRGMASRHVEVEIAPQFEKLKAK
jgi:hypothetical protein